MFLNGIFFALLTISAVYYFFPSEWTNIISAFIMPFSLGWLAKALLNGENRKLIIKNKKFLEGAKGLTRKLENIFISLPKKLTIVAVISALATISITFFTNTPLSPKIFFSILNPVFQSIIAAYIFYLIDIHFPKIKKNRISISMIAASTDRIFHILSRYLDEKPDNAVMDIYEFKEKLDKHDGLWRSETSSKDLFSHFSHFAEENIFLIENIEKYHSKLIEENEVSGQIKSIKSQAKFILKLENKEELSLYEHSVKSILSSWIKIKEYQF